MINPGVKQKSFTDMLYKKWRTCWQSLIAGICLLLASLSAHALGERDDVLIIVNDNSLDSPQLGAYYAQQRNINPANIVHLKVPDSYFISWTDFRRLRDQLIRFMQQPSMLDDPTLTPVVCADGEPPYYCQASMDQLRAHTRIRYLVTTRGVPTRMTVDGSTLSFSGSPTSVDNYLKYWLINYFADDVQLKFTEREVAFGDGSGMRPVEPATDRELIVGRIDGLDLNAARALVDRAIMVEGKGLYGTWYGSTKFLHWLDASSGSAIYPKFDSSLIFGSSTLGWRYALGLWGEDRAECVAYLDFSGFLAEGKAPAHCRVKFNDDSDPARQTTLGITYPAPGNTSSRMPLVVDALGYQGWLDGQATLGSFTTLLNWRKDDQCTVTLCDDAVDPAACRAKSTDIFGELNTDCVGVADGFMAYNHTSWPMSYLAIWPTGWFQSDRIGSSGWNDGGHGDLNQLAFPEVSNGDGFDDNNSLWFRNTDQIATPLCYTASDFSGIPSVPCADQRRLVLSQKITLASQNVSSAQTYRVALHYKTLNIASNVDLRVRLFIHETGADDALIDYGVKTLALLTPVDTNGWTAAEVFFTLDPALHTASSYDGIKITLDTPTVFAGDLGIDVVRVQETTAGLELTSNGSFSLGHRQAVSGDHAATFLNRLGGVAAWGSVGHHQSSGSAFASNGLESMIYFLRGLPLGDAVWFNESNNSGILYGDPLYSPVAVRLNPFNNTQNGSIDLFGSTVNGRDPAQVDTSYRIDVCPGNDFYTCDQAQSWQDTFISGTGGSENTLLGSLDTTLLPVGDYTLRLQVNSLHSVSSRSQTIADYYTVAMNDAPVAVNTSLDVVEDTVKASFLPASDADGDALTYSIVSNGTKGTVTITNAATGIYSYTPNPDATGPDSFTFKANDGLLDSNIATISVNIAAVNDAPVAVNSTQSVTEDVAVNGVLNASDVDGDSLSYSIVSNGLKGSVVITNTITGAYSYTPNANATGADSFTFKVNDGMVDSNIATITVNITATNNPPVSVDASFNTDEDVVASGALSASDIDGDSLSYSLVSNAIKGTVLITNASTGAFSYTPNANATGTDSFTFKVNDGLLDSNIATVSLSIAAVNDVPVAVSTSLNTNEDVAASGVLSASDIDGDTLTFSLVSNGSKGTVLITNTSTGVYSYTPNPNANGTDSFSFKVNDGLIDSNIATVSLSIAAVNDAPVAVSTSLNTNENTAVNGIMSASDIDADVLSYSLISKPDNGTVVITNAATGAYSYTPNVNATGSDSFTFRVNDGLLDSNIATVTLNITLVNVAPVASNGTMNTNEDTVANGLLAATDGDNDPLLYSIVSNTSQGVVALTNTSTGAYIYAPNANATGTDSFTFKVNDGLLDSNIATVSLSIAAVNDVPVAVNASLNTNEDIAVNGNLSASDVDADSLTYSIISNGLKGSVLVTNTSNGTYIYTPDANATGTDSFTFKVNDGLTDSNIATVSINITAVNDAPLASAGTLLTNEDTAASGSLNASDIDGDALTYSMVGSATKGSVTITNAVTGTYSYTPNANATGADSFTFKVNDGLLNSNVATVTVNITAQNDAPVASNINLNTLENTTAIGVLNANDPDGDALSYSIVSNASMGVALITNTSTGAYHYTPNANASGSDSFSFKVNDGLLDSNIATVTVNITLINVAPSASNSVLNTNEDSVAFGSLAASDGDSDPLIYLIVSNASQGVVVLTNISTGAYTYTPNANATGADSFSFKVNDGLADSNIATVSINITAVNDAPLASAGTLLTNEDTAASGSLIASDIDGNALTYIIVTNAGIGTAVITNAVSGAYSYTPNPNANGVDSFSFKANDGLADSNITMVSVGIAAVNDAPVATNTSLNTIENTAVNGTFSASDIDADALSYSLISNPVNGTVVITNAATGAYSYTPNANASGSDSFSFKVNDGLLDSNIATVTVNITLVNVAPLASNSTLNTNEDSVAFGSLAASDGDSDPLIYSIVSNASQGVVALTNISTGAYSYTPNANATGNDSFSFKVSDGLVDSNIATVSVSIAAVNDVPVAVNASMNTNEDTAVNGSLSASDVDGDNLSYSIVSNGLIGSVLITNTATGAYTYTPNANATGADSFTFKASDGLIDSNFATVSININAVNDAPLANTGTLTTNEDVAASGNLNASDIDGDTLTYSIVGNGTKGSVSLINAATGTYSYTPNANATGADSFTFKANDGLLDSNIATVSVSITALNDAPVANNGNLNTNEDVAVNGMLSASDADGNPLIYSVVTNGGKGTAIITNTATGAYTYTPIAGTTGIDSFTFIVNDGLVDSNIASITINLAQVNDVPIANNGNLNIDEDVTVSAVLSASDIDGDALTYTIVTNGSKGTVAITNAATGVYTYTPNPNANGVDSFSFKVNDGQVGSNTATVNVVIAAVNDAPLSNNASISTDEDLAANGVLSASDVDGDALSYNLVSIGDKGVAFITNASTGAYSYTPNANATGIDNFSFKVSDGLLDSNIATVSVSITAVNDVTAPDSNGDGLSDADAIALGLDPNDPDGDTDNDGVSDVDETGGNAINPLPLDSDGDGVIDALEPGSSATDAATASGVEMNSGTMVSLTNTSGETLSAVSTESVTNGSDGFNFPYGALSFTASVPTGEVRITIRLSFSLDLPADLAIFKTDDNGNVIGKVPNEDWIRLDNRNIDMTLTDGGPFDQDGLVDGKVVDPLALGVSTTPPTDGDGSSSSSGTVDLWLLLMLGFLGMLRHRAQHYTE